MQSTDVNRTLQSGYSELMGLFPPASSTQSLSQGELESLKSGRGMPKMKVSGADRINSELGSDALPNGFVSLPITTFSDFNLQDDVSYDGCAYAVDTTDQRYALQSAYLDWQWIANFAKYPLADSLGLDYSVVDEATFLNVYHY